MGTDQPPIPPAPKPLPCKENYQVIPAWSPTFVPEDPDLASKVMPDHVRVFIRVGSTDSPGEVARAFKGRTARVLRQEFGWLRKGPALWSKSFFAASVGYVSEATVRRHIEHQWDEEA